MADKRDFENGRISNFQRLVTLSLTLDRATWHIVVHHSSTSTYTPNFVQIGETCCGWTYGGMDRQTSRLAFLGGLGGVDLKINSNSPKVLRDCLCLIVMTSNWVSRSHDWRPCRQTINSRHQSLLVSQPTNNKQVSTKWQWKNFYWSTNTGKWL